MSETILITAPLLMKGLWLTIKISMWTVALGSFLGFVIGLIRASRMKILKAALGVYIHCLRGTPFLVQLYLIYFVLPATGVEWLKFEAFPAAVIALSLYTSTYVSEIVRAGIEAVPKGQVEAARALGMSKWQTLGHVILPQALKLMIPPMTGVYVLIIKGTSVVSVIGITELLRAGEQAALRYPSELMTLYGLVALLYFVYCYPVLRLGRWAETKFGRIENSL
ncbi:MAG: amino acid ABC transporter permease [Nitrospina sp.]|nr:MAG: amino acid ABC transporter permease [Nitrospina sp.]